MNDSYFDVVVAPDYFLTNKSIIGLICVPLLPPFCGGVRLIHSLLCSCIKKVITLKNN